MTASIFKIINLNFQSSEIQVPTYFSVSRLKHILLLATDYGGASEKTECLL